MLKPRNTWEDQGAYDHDLKLLISKFQENFKKFDIEENIVLAGPGF